MLPLAPMLLLFSSMYIDCEFFWREDPILLPPPLLSAKLCYEWLPILGKLFSFAISSVLPYG